MKKTQQFCDQKRGESGRETARYREERGGGGCAKYSIESAREKKLKRWIE